MEVTGRFVDYWASELLKCPPIKVSGKMFDGRFVD